MRKLSQTAFLAAVAALTLPAAPALAMQDEAPAAPPAMSAEQQSAMMAWPQDTKAFFASLSPDQQQVFMALSDEDKVTLSRMDPAQRDDVMRQLQARLQGAAGAGR